MDKNQPMNLQEFVGWCKLSKQRHIQIIAEWADTIKPDFRNYGQWEVFIKRHLRAAKELSVFADDQLTAAFGKIEQAQKDGWLKKFTLETLIKFLI